MGDIDPEKVVALYKSRANGITKIRLIETDHGYAIVGNLTNNPYKYIEENFYTYHEAVERWNSLLSQAETPF